VNKEKFPPSPRSQVQECSRVFKSVEEFKSPRYSPVDLKPLVFGKAEGAGGSGSSEKPEKPEKTNFEQVVDFVKCFGQPHHETPQLGVFESDAKLVKFRLSLITEELRELEEAMTQHDLVEAVDALGDILYVVYGAGSAFGVNLDKAFDLVHRSNM